jgi:hypothetical protein
MHLPIGFESPQTGDYRLLVNVQTGTARINDVHEKPPGDAPGEDIEQQSNLLCVLPNKGGNNFGYAAMSGTRLTHGFENTTV